MTTNIKFLIGILALTISALLFYFESDGIARFLRGFLLAIGIVFIVRTLIEIYKKK